MHRWFDVYLGIAAAALQQRHLKVLLPSGKQVAHHGSAGVNGSCVLPLSAWLTPAHDSHPLSTVKYSEPAWDP